MRIVRDIGLTLVMIVVAFVLWPLPADLLEHGNLESIRVTDRHGRSLRQLRSKDGHQNQRLAEGLLPADVVAAFIAAEDQRFDWHIGVDALAVARAFYQDVTARRIVSGASTLTEQLARMLVPRRRTPIGKLKEALWALRLSAHLSRQQILREYLDRVSLGNGAVGVEAAAEIYFGRPAATLSVGQAALLAGLARSPVAGEPYQHLARARLRMQQVLLRMERTGYLSADQRRVALMTPLDERLPEHPFKAPHFVNHLLAERTERGLESATLFETTIDSGLERDVEQIIDTDISQLVDRHVAQAAAIVVDNSSGDILAYVGSRRFADESKLGQNDGVSALRQPGSTLKPFIYGLALSRSYTPATILPDIETHFATNAGDFVPKNYDRRVHGPVRLRVALQNSYNVPAVRLGEALGIEQMLSVLHQAGFDSLNDDAEHYGVGLILGDGDVSLRQLARAYRGLARGGVLEPLRDLRAASDAEKRPLVLAPELRSERFLPADAVNLLTDILSDEGSRAPAFGLENALRLPFPVAAKTGTSRAYVDNWTVGFTHERTVAVWVGNFDGQPMRHVSGITGAGPLFQKIMIRAMRGIEPAPLVDRSRLVTADICPLSGQLAGPSCPSRVHEKFLPGTVPVSHCAMHRSDERGMTLTDVGPEFAQWANAEGLTNTARTGGEDLAKGHDAHVVSSPRFILPTDGDEYLLEPDVPLAGQQIPIRVLAADTELEVRSDTGAVLTLQAPFVSRLPVAPGRHWLELWHAGGKQALARVEYRVR